MQSLVIVILIIVVLGQEAQGSFRDRLLRNHSRFELCLGGSISRTHGSVLANVNGQCWSLPFRQCLRIVLFCCLFDNRCSALAVSLQSHSLNVSDVFRSFLGDVHVTFHDFVCHHCSKQCRVHCSSLSA